MQARVLKNENKHGMRLTNTQYRDSSVFLVGVLEDVNLVMLQVEWGEASMIQAERLLLGAALKDPANQRFVLLSDRFVPLS